MGLGPLKNNSPVLVIYIVKMIDGAEFKATSLLIDVTATSFLQTVELVCSFPPWKLVCDPLTTSEPVLPFYWRHCCLNLWGQTYPQMNTWTTGTHTWPGSLYYLSSRISFKLNSCLFFFLNKASLCSGFLSNTSFVSVLCDVDAHPTF